MSAARSLHAVPDHASDGGSCCDMRKLQETHIETLISERNVAHGLLALSRSEANARIARLKRRNDWLMMGLIFASLLACYCGWRRG